MNGQKGFIQRLLRVNRGTK